MRIGIEREIAYGHRLMHHPGKCSKVHGHNAKIVVELEGIVDEKTGMVADFSHVKNAVNSVILQYDHSFILNSNDPDLAKLKDITGIICVRGEPTAENLVNLIYGDLIDIFETQKIRVARVEFWETSTNYAVVGERSDVYK